MTGSLTAGDTLSISGTVVIDGTTYTISSGTAQMSPSATSISGQGATTPSGDFLLQASAHGSFVGSNGQVSLDLSNGTTEYLVSLAARSRARRYSLPFFLNPSGGSRSPFVADVPRVDLR